MRQAVALEAKIANNAFAPRPQSARRPWSTPNQNHNHLARLDEEDLDYDEEEERPNYNPIDRGNLYEAVGTLSLTHPNHEEILQTLDATITETLTAHPNDHLSANFARICQIFSIPPDRFQLEPHLESQLRPPPEPHNPKPPPPD